EGTTTFDIHVTMGNLELIVPPDLPVDLDVQSVTGNVSDWRKAGPRSGTKRLRIRGKVKAGNCEVTALAPGQTKRDLHRARHDRFKEMHAERHLWHQHGHSHWMPWWLQARTRRRIFSWLAIAFVGGVAAGVHLWVHRHWWYVPIALATLGLMSGMVAWRMTAPLIMAIKAARDIGDGKLDTRLPTGQRGEMRILAGAVNEMAERIQRQINDQKALLAAVSHELRTPLGHMRVLVETARDTGDKKSLDEMEREILMLDDLVGKLLASSRLEFGNLDRRSVDLGELVTTAAEGVEVISDGDLHASVDPTLMRRAVANLIDNARVHGGGAVRVRVERRGPQIAVEVDDAGPGVPADRRADAFRAFVPSSGGGLGLGLALVSRIAVAHGGGAWIADRPGGGARVGFTVQA
ncbi:MAG: HAMP domain-containing protein, partial [Deltaproteobacteria bacterium]|nr:HAMP domain-containing protein [Deltaproteobacteria bacterium]